LTWVTFFVLAFHDVFGDKKEEAALIFGCAFFVVVLVLVNQFHYECLPKKRTIGFCDFYLVANYLCSRVFENALYAGKGGDVSATFAMDLLYQMLADQEVIDNLERERPLGVGRKASGSRSSIPDLGAASGSGSGSDLEAGATDDTDTVNGADVYKLFTQHLKLNVAEFTMDLPEAVATTRRKGFTYCTRLWFDVVALALKISNTTTFQVSVLLSIFFAMVTDVLNTYSTYSGGNSLRQAQLISLVFFSFEVALYLIAGHSILVRGRTQCST
jgi:hypothetical protein